MHARHADVPLGGKLLHVHELEDGGFPRAARSGEKRELPLLDVEGHVIEGQPTACVLLADVDESDHRASLAAGSTADAVGGSPSESSSRQLVCAVTASNTA